MRLHADQVDTDATLVRALLADQFPAWGALDVTPVRSAGTDHDLYRVGDDLVARLPTIGWATGQAAKEATWLPRLAPHLPLELPVLLGRGRPGHGYPYAWSVCRWLPGHDATEGLGDREQAAVDLAAFVAALRSVSTRGAPARGPHDRGGSLRDGDDEVRTAVAVLGDRVDEDAVLRVWQEAVEAPTAYDDVWLHGDLLPGNLLVADGRLSAVIDFGCLTVGDPAADLLPAWHLFSGSDRARFRAELAVDDASWSRGRGWALRQAVVALPYYWETSPAIVRRSLRALDALSVAERGELEAP